MSGGAGKAMKRSSQMEAVMRLMTGKEERTVAEKIADPNRPTWEQYKKDNEDKLNLEGVDEKKMQAYRQELDQDREKFLSRQQGAVAKKKKKRKSSDRKRKHSSKKKRKKKEYYRKKKHRKHYSDSDNGSYSSDSSSDDSRRRKRHKKKKRKDKERKSDKSSGEVMDDRYKLSTFFTKDSDEEE
jgi:hypothetical protein